MRRPIGEVLSAWFVLLPAALRILVRRVRRFRPVPRGEAAAVQADTAHGTVSFGIGVQQPVRLDGRTVATLTTHDDAGTSTAESVLTWVAGSSEAPVATVLEAIADASFGRGNHRAAVWACLEQPVLTEALPRAGFQLEGAASPPWGDTREWQMWARLSTDPAVD